MPSIPHLTGAHALLALLLAARAWSAPQAPAGDAPPPDDTAHCIAAMQTVGDELARKVRAGDRAQEPALRAELDRAAALIGRTYFDGFRSSREAKARLRAAQQEQAGWDEARRQKLHAACVKRADAELTSANAVQRFVYRQFAQSQYKKMVEAPATSTPRPAATPASARSSAPPAR
ncbi:MAG: hypothetical protein HS128_03660 [Ideonella sp.]|nr:hypothetical protein [Ideonella sp.]MCC7458708.1 hypothetical protein [Nitrospira sp.]